MRQRHRGWRAALLAVALALLTAPQASARISASVDRTETTLQQQIRLSVTVEGSRSAQPQLPELPDFEVYPTGQATQMTLMNGRATSSVTFTYVLVPRKTGLFTIGAATVELDGRTFSSEPFQVRVVEASQTPGESSELFVTVKVSTTKPYVGQQVIYTWRLYRRVRISDARLEPQSFDGFLVENLGDVREYETTVRGQSYLVSEVRKALFPQEEGMLEVPASRLSCQVLLRQSSRRRGVFDDLFSASRAESRILRTQPIPLEVRPLPAPPPDFSGLVGSFELGTKVSRADLEVGESATLEMTVSGRGNVQLIGEPRLPPLSSFKVYDDKPRASIERSFNGLSGSRSFRKALVPLEAGDLILPAITLTYFDPEAGSYRTSRSPQIALRVSPAEGPEELRLTESMAPTTGKVAVRILADDILPIYKGVEALAPRDGWMRSPATLAAGLLAPPILYLGALLAHRRRRRFELDAGLRRRREALRRARRALASLADKAASDPGAAAPAASLCLREYIGDKLNVEGAALTPPEAGRLLRTAGAGESLAAETQRLLERLEAVQYGAGELESGELAARIRALLPRLERGIGG